MSAWATEGDESDIAVEEIESALPVVIAGDLDSADQLLEQITSRLTPIETESFGNALRSIGRWASDRNNLTQLAGTVLPYAGTGLGAVVGGPIGATIGRSLATQAGQAIAGGRPSMPPGGAGVLGGVQAPVASAPQLAAPGGGSPSAAKLLHLVQNPAFLSSLVSLALGPQGQKTVPVGGGQVPLGAFLNLASKLTGEALQDADSAFAESETVSDWYLRNEGGCLTCDPSVPGRRADALWNLLQREDEVTAELADAYEELAYGESVWDSENWED